MNGNEKNTAVDDDMADAIESLDDIKDSNTGDVPVEDFDKAEPESSSESVAAKPAEPLPAEETAQVRWDKERQRAEQSEANYRKAQTERDVLAAKGAAADQRIQELDLRLAELTKAEDVNLDDVDDSITDPKVIKAIKSLQSQIKAEQEQTKAERVRREAIEAEITAYKQQSHKEQTTQAVISNVETKLHSRLGVDNPARFRNEALKLANQICEDRGYSPIDRYEAAEMLEDCYMELTGAAKTQSPAQGRSVPTDSGKGAARSPVTVEAAKPCSLKEANKEFRKSLGL